MMCFI